MTTGVVAEEHDEETKQCGAALHEEARAHIHDEE